MGGRSNKRTIQRTLLPNLNTHPQPFRTTDMHYFYKIKRNLKLEDWQKDRDTPQLTNQSSKHAHRFNISPRLTQLSQHRTWAAKTVDADTSQQVRSKRMGASSKQQSFNQGYFKKNHFFFVKQDSLQYTEEDNIGKNINGTKLGIFSQQVIQRKLEDSWQKHQNIRANAPSLARQEDSDSEAVEQKQLKQVDKRKRKMSLISMNASKGCGGENRLLELIYGDEQFLQKYRAQQMSLMQKHSVYRQKKLTLDYKDEWKV